MSFPFASPLEYPYFAFVNIQTVEPDGQYVDNGQTKIISLDDPDDVDERDRYVWTKRGNYLRGQWNCTAEVLARIEQVKPLLVQIQSLQSQTLTWKDVEGIVSQKENLETLVIAFDAETNRANLYVYVPSIEHLMSPQMRRAAKVAICTLEPRFILHKIEST